MQCQASANAGGCNLSTLARKVAAYGCAGWLCGRGRAAAWTRTTTMETTGQKGQKRKM